MDASLPRARKKGIHDRSDRPNEADREAKNPKDLERGLHHLTDDSEDVKDDDHADHEDSKSKHVVHHFRPLREKTPVPKDREFKGGNANGGGPIRKVTVTELWDRALGIS
jgi:hypothetical protein